MKSFKLIHILNLSISHDTTDIVDTLKHSARYKQCAHIHMRMLIAPVLAGFLFGSCRTSKSLAVKDEFLSDHREVSVSILHDSIYLHDSIHVTERGCTLEVTRWKIERHVIRDLQRDTLRDTIYMNHERNVEKVVQVKYVPNGLKIMLVSLSIPLIYMLYNMFLQKRRK